MHSNTIKQNYTAKDGVELHTKPGDTTEKLPGRKDRPCLEDEYYYQLMPSWMQTLAEMSFKDCINITIVLTVCLIFGSILAGIISIVFNWLF